MKAPAQNPAPAPAWHQQPRQFDPNSPNLYHGTEQATHMNGWKSVYVFNFPFVIFAQIDVNSGEEFVSAPFRD